MGLYRILLLMLLTAGCKEKKNDSLLGHWQIMRLEGKDSGGRDLYVYNANRDTSKKYVSFINDTTYKGGPKTKNAVDTVRYILTGDSIFSKRGIRNYSLKMITSDSALITGDDHSSITIVRVNRANKR
ncbi:MAG: hypothetical protein ACTHMD_02075 [Flavisolibacter sp.]